MMGTVKPAEQSTNPLQVEIRLQGHLATRWADWFPGLHIHLEDAGITRLTGSVPDQAALHGLLRNVRDLGLPLLSVHLLESIENQSGKPD
jgi:hypothetical protein